MYLSIDLGRSTTRVASTMDLHKIYKIVKFPTDTNFENQVKHITTAVYDVTDGNHVEAIALGVPGILDKATKKFVASANYPILAGLPFNSLLPESLKNSKLVVENDALLGGLGEAYFGAGVDFNIVTYLTLSTGVGGTRIEKNRDKYTFIESEPGHQVISETDKIADKTGIFGTFESFCSGSYFEMRYGEKPTNIKNDKIWREYARHLASGITNIIALWKPEVVILGGGISNNFDSFYPFLNEYLSQQDFFEIPTIVQSQLGDDSGIYGGFALLGGNK